MPEPEVDTKLECEGTPACPCCGDPYDPFDDAMAEIQEREDYARTWDGV